MAMSIELQPTDIYSSFIYVNTAAPDNIERFQSLLAQEKVYSIKSYADIQIDGFNSSWRKRIVDWLYQVADAYALSRETVCIAMSFLDRYLTTASCNKYIFKLAAMCSLFLAAKMQEGRPVRMTDIVSLARGIFTQSDLKRMEITMLRKLKWHLHPPTPGAFVRSLLYCLKNQSQDQMRVILELSEFNTELSVCEYFFLTYSPSQIGAASLMNALQQTAEPPSQTDIKCFVEVIREEYGFEVCTNEIKSCETALKTMYASSILQVDDVVVDVNTAGANNNGEEGEGSVEVEGDSEELGNEEVRGIASPSPTGVEAVEAIEAEAAAGRGKDKDNDNDAAKKHDEDDEDDSEVASINNQSNNNSVTTSSLSSSLSTSSLTTTTSTASRVDSTRRVSVSVNSGSLPPNKNKNQAMRLNRCTSFDSTQRSSSPYTSSILSAATKALIDENEEGMSGGRKRRLQSCLENGAEAGGGYTAEGYNMNGEIVEGSIDVMGGRMKRCNSANPGFYGGGQY